MRFCKKCASTTTSKYQLCKECKPLYCINCFNKKQPNTKKPICVSCWWDVVKKEKADFFQLFEITGDEIEKKLNIKKE